jgi:hypothetical protein
MMSVVETDCDPVVELPPMTIMFLLEPCTWQQRDAFLKATEGKPPPRDPVTGAEYPGYVCTQVRFERVENDKMRAEALYIPLPKSKVIKSGA